MWCQGCGGSEASLFTLSDFSSWVCVRPFCPPPQGSLSQRAVIPVTRSRNSQVSGCNWRKRGHCDPQGARDGAERESPRSGQQGVDKPILKVGSVAEAGPEFGSPSLPASLPSFSVRVCEGPNLRCRLSSSGVGWGAGQTLAPAPAVISVRAGGADAGMFSLSGFVSLKVPDPLSLCTCPQRPSGCGSRVPTRSLSLSLTALVSSSTQPGD